MKSLQAYHFLVILLSSTATSVVIAAPNYAKQGCDATCGKVRIPYPFGIGAKCSVNKWYVVDCNSSTPYLSALKNLQILSVNLGNQTVTVKMPTISNCKKNRSESKSVDVGKSPFLFSRSHNKFVVEGYCGNAVILENRNTPLTGCSTACRNDKSEKSNTSASCLGMTCCQTQIPHHLRSYSIKLTGLSDQDGSADNCGSSTASAFLVDEISYAKHQSSASRSAQDGTTFVPTSLLWTLTDSDLDQVNCCRGFTAGSIRKVDLANGTAVYTWKCFDYYMRPFIGNPYLLNGCDDTDECANCKDNGGNCERRQIQDVDGVFKEWNITCDYSVGSLPYKRLDFTILTYIGVSIGGLVLVGTIYAVYKLITRTITRRRREEVFKRINGRLLLKQQEEVDPSLVDKTILFKSSELEKATDRFNENRILGRGGQGTVYKGMLVDGRIVAVKRSKIVDESQLEQFINEVVILSQVNHRNVVKLLGCCLETEVPLLVSEFISNGTLYDLLHNENHEISFSWNMRLQIATEVAGALAYLHSSTSIPIYHRDVKTTNILLDDKYRPKISDFGTSRFISMDQTHLTTLVKGTLGYLDPEYFQSSQFTEKSDVYSFGVVLAELLTGEKPISLTRFGENRSLATHFILAMQEERVMSIFDAIVIKDGSRDELRLVASLAMQCLNPIGKNRPTMKEVAIELETMRTSHVNSIDQANTEPAMYQEQLPMLANGETSALLCDDNISQ